MLRLDYVIRDYDWGSPTDIPSLLGFEPTGKPVAELWLGAHRLASARVTRDPDDVGTPLCDLLSRDPAACLGPSRAELPFLLKILGVASPLSLQVHPDLEQARVGYEREEALGVPLNAPERNFRDPNHKPEMIYALSSFDALSGFKTTAAIRQTIQPLAADSTVAAGMIERLTGSEAEGLRATMTWILTSPDVTPAGIEELVAAARRAVGSNCEDPGAYTLPVTLARAHAGDRGIAVAMMLRHISLAPGEACLVPSGVIHAYLRGLGVEVMAASDNVVRAGLTSKHVDAATLLSLTDFTSQVPPRPRVERSGPARLLTGAVKDFALADVRLDGTYNLALTGPRIGLVLDGEMTAFSKVNSLHVSRGQSLFALASEGPVELRGKGRIVFAAPG
jgi:mannose-6-phosphate isomerase